METMRVLIADQDSAFRNNLKKALVQKGFIVIGEAGDGLTALRLTQSIQPDLVLTSHDLPVYSGLELAKTLRKIRLLLWFCLWMRLIKIWCIM